MKHQVEVPAVGESVTSGILATWFKNDGELVKEGEDLFELETDKATLPVPAPVGGVVSIKIPVDEEVEIGTVVAEIDTDAAPAAGTSAAQSPAEPAAQAETAAAQTETAEALSPAVRRILADHNLAADTVAAAVKPSGKDGRLTKEDVQRYVDSAATSAAPTAGAAPAAKPQPTAPRVAAPDEVQVRKPMSNLRKRIAANLVASKQGSAHLTTFNEVDMSELMAIRSRHKEAFEKRHEVRLGFMSFFVRASVNALRAFPNVNAYVDGTDVIYNNFYNVGIAISTDAGLIVPVLRNADAMSFADIEAAIVDFATRAKAKRIMPDEFTGGTFTITNGGVFGSMLSTPIPSPPQTAVMGMHSIKKRAVVVDDQIVIRPIMYLALTYDHRIIDGREAIRFLGAIKDQIEDPSGMLLGL